MLMDKIWKSCKQLWGMYGTYPIIFIVVWICFTGFLHVFARFCHSIVLQMRKKWMVRNGCKVHIAGVFWDFWSINKPVEDLCVRCDASKVQYKHDPEGRWNVGAKWCQTTTLNTSLSRTSVSYLFISFVWTSFSLHPLRPYLVFPSQSFPEKSSLWDPECRFNPIKQKKLGK